MPNSHIDEELRKRIYMFEPNIPLREFMDAFDYSHIVILWRKALLNQLQHLTEKEKTALESKIFVNSK